jgi:hypothetical protein
MFKKIENNIFELYSVETSVLLPKDSTSKVMASGLVLVFDFSAFLNSSSFCTLFSQLKICSERKIIKKLAFNFKSFIFAY